MYRATFVRVTSAYNYGDFISKYTKREIFREKLLAKQTLTVTKCMANECDDDLTLKKSGKHPVRPMKTQTLSYLIQLQTITRYKLKIIFIFF